MKLKIKLVYSTYSDFENKKLHVSSFYDDVDFEIDVRKVTVEIPDDAEFTEKEFNDALYFKKLNHAEKEVKKKRDELFQAEEAVKNMLAIPAEIVDIEEKEPENLASNLQSESEDQENLRLFEKEEAEGINHEFNN